MIEQLQAHWGFSRMPFGRDLAPSMLHTHRSHREAVARITWIIAERCLGVITGEVGAGKTVAVRAATAACDQSRHRIIYIPNPTIGSRGIYQHIVTSLGATPSHYKAALIPQTYELLETEHDERGKTVVLVLDESHLLDHQQLEEIRLMTNVQMDSRNLFATILIGQPTLTRRIRLGAFAALDQRIALRYQLAAMTAEETADYIAHHINLAGRPDTLYSEDAIALIHTTGRGLPRAVNNLAISALIAAYADDKAIVDEKSARTAVTEMTT